MIIFTDHALERMRERFPTKEHKFYKIAEKAWQSKQKTKRRIKKVGENCVYRIFYGFIFVFEIKDESPVLVTLYSIKS